MHNPYITESAFTVGNAATLPAPLFDKPTSDVGKEAVRLHKAARMATGRLQEVRDATHDAVQAVQAARAALAAEVQRGAVEGLDQEREQALSLELAAAERLADPEVHTLRSRTAVAAQKRRVRDYNAFVFEHLVELMDEELREEAVAASEALVDALQSITPVQERYRAVQRRSWALARMAAVGQQAEHWSRVLQLAPEPAPPLPSDDGLDAFARAIRPPVEA